MKILVIGASSFTGKHFCEYARQQGAEVVEGNMRYMHWFPEAKDNYVVNFAAVNVVAPSWDKPGLYMKVNVGLVTKLAEGLRDYMPKKYVHISTPEVYGSTTGFVHEDAPYNPSTPYAVSRAAAEMMLKCYHKEYDLPVVFTRSCNVYGPGQQLYRLIPKLIVSIRKGIKFPLEGGGASRRAFLYVDDVCAAIWRVMTDGILGEAYNITNHVSHSIEEIARLVCTIMEVDPDTVLEIAPERPGKDKEYTLDSTKLYTLGWNHYQTSWLSYGIMQTVDWIDANWDTLKDQSLDYTN
jgi:dTDP-glucose 4,6-dehydratase